MSEGPCLLHTMGTPELVDLRRGHPDPTLLPAERLRAAAEARISLGALNYGRMGGRKSFVAALSGFLEANVGAPAPAETLFVTAGASHGLDLIAAYLAKPGDTVVVETPTYFLAIEVLRRRGLNVITVPVDDEGPRIEALRAVAAQTRPAFFYCIPAFQNPSGVSTSPARRREIVALAQELDFLVVADEVYQLLHFGTPPPPPMRTFDPERVLSLGSFSKILAPGLRLGWVEAAPQHLRRFEQDGMLLSGGGMNPWTQAVVRPLLEDGGLADIIQTFRAGYEARAQALTAGLRGALGSDLRGPKGGYFVWARLPEGLSAQALLPVARAHGVSFLPGPACCAERGHENFLRASFALYPPKVLEEGARRLGRAVREAAS